MSDDDRARVQEFFACRAAGWDAKFPDDGPRFEAAVRRLGPLPGGRVLDAGCGTGRALPALRELVGPAGTVLGADLTRAMLHEAVRRGRDRAGALLEADVARLPLPDAGLDAVFASGLLTHLPGPAAGLRELARVVRTGGTLALFHPVGRAALAARQGRTLAPEDLRARPRLEPLLADCGWHLLSYVDEDERFLALAERRTGAVG